MKGYNSPWEERYNLDDEIPPKCTHPKESLVERTSHSEKNPGRNFVSCQLCNSFIRWADAKAEPNDFPSPKRPRDESAEFQTNAPFQHPASRPREDPDMVYYLRRFIFALNKLSDSIERTSDYLYRMEKAKRWESR